MRIGVIGAGAVGGAFAAALARLGHEVEVTARGAHLEAIREHGIRLTGSWGEFTAHVDANELLSRGAELVIVATKAQDAPAAIEANVAFLRGIPLLVIQNGLDGVTAARAASPRSDVVGGLALFATSYLSPGTITITTGGSLTIGGGDGETDLPARYIKRVLDDVLPVTIVPNFVGAQWSKLVVNQLNALPAITGRSAQEVIADRALRSIMTRSIQETVRVAMRIGIRFEAVQGLTDRRLRLIARAPIAIAQALPLLMRRRLGPTPNPGSTLQSIRRGQATEIDYLNGAVVRTADAHGLAAPVNRALVALVHEVEQSGEHLSAAEVERRIPR